jgi:hypothetical protein
VLLKYLLNAAANIDKATKQKGIQLQLIPIEQQNGQEKKLFNEILVNLKKIDINKITPLDAFNLLLQWKKIIEQDIQGQNDENTNG